MRSGSENIHIPQANPHFGPRNRQARPSAESKGNNIAEDGDTLYRAKSEIPTASINEGRRLYVGNLAYATTKEDHWNFFHEFSM